MWHHTWRKHWKPRRWRSNVVILHEYKAEENRQHQLNKVRTNLASEHGLTQVENRVHRGRGEMGAAHLGMPLEEVHLLEGRRERVAHL